VIVPGNQNWNEEEEERRSTVSATYHSSEMIDIIGDSPNAVGRTFRSL